MADRWKNRRWMAWLALLGGLGFPILVVLAKMEQLSAIAPHFYLFVGAVVGCYVGFATMDDKWTAQEGGK
jgi:hypothetical protein